MKQTLERLRAEFLEMPGLQLTMDQVHRLCGVDRPMCSAVLDALVQERFLCVTADGRYGRVSDGRVPRPRPAKADLDAAHSVSSDFVASARARLANSTRRASTR